VKTRTIEIINFENLPAGQNASVAIMSYSGYDIEDAVILNRGSLDRGFGRAMYIRRYQTDIRKYANGATDIILPYVTPKDPKKANSILSKKYHALDVDGMARIGESLSNGDVFVHKYVHVINESQSGYMS